MTGELQLPDESVEVPECDCILEYDGPKLHRPGCEHIAAIIRKYHGPEVEARYLAGEWGS